MVSQAATAKIDSLARANAAAEQANVGLNEQILLLRQCAATAAAVTVNPPPTLLPGSTGATLSHNKRKPTTARTLTAKAVKASATACKKLENAIKQASPHGTGVEMSDPAVQGTGIKGHATGAESLLLLSMAAAGGRK